MNKLILWKFLKSNVATAIFSVLSFLGGLVLSKLIEQILSNKAGIIEPLIEGSILISIILVSIYLSIQFTELKHELHKQKLTVKVSYPSIKNQDKQIYESLNEAIAEAKKSIKVIAMFRPHDLPLSNGRDRYYKLIEEVLHQKIELNHPFIYERIIQVEKITPGILASDQIDLVTFNHCKKILDWKNQRSAVSMYVKQIPDILGALTFLIVDDEKFFVAIPDIVRKESEILKLEGLQLSLSFEDAEGLLIEPMKSFFSRIFNEAEPVMQVVQSQST